MAYLLPQLLEESAVVHADNIAIRFGDAEFSYAELDSLTNQIAHQLISLGVSRGDRVGIYVNKSIASILSVFSIMKLGAAYVPLDPNAPAERLAFIARDCNIKVLLSVPEKINKSPDLLHQETPIEAVVLLAAGEVVPKFSQEMVAWESTSKQACNRLVVDGFNENDLAYILYTSGSTGNPKGVMISHRTILTFVNWAADEVGLTSDDRTTSHAPLHFDLSTFDIYSTIKVGATLVLIPEGFSIFPVKLAELISTEKVTVTYLVPSILVLLLTRGNLAQMDLTNLRTVVFAGEVFAIKYLKQLASILPDVDLFNWFGPTETNVCTSYKVRPADLAPDQNEPLSIGKACMNTEGIIVDDDGSIVSGRRVTGELWIRGPCVAQGYWNNNDATEKGFILNPFQTSFKDRVYRTGDIVERDEDDNFIYHGRRDHMVKTRGYRVELGDIETHLNNYAEVSMAAVAPVPDDLVGNVLIAFVEPNEGCELQADELIKHCAKSLPRYMLPEKVIFVSSMPTTSSGKIHRFQLGEMAKNHLT